MVRSPHWSLVIGIWSLLSGTRHSTHVQHRIARSRLARSPWELLWQFHERRDLSAARRQKSFTTRLALSTLPKANPTLSQLACDWLATVARKMLRLRCRDCRAVPAGRRRRCDYLFDTGGSDLPSWYESFATVHRRLAPVGNLCQFSGLFLHTHLCDRYKI